MNSTAFLHFLDVGSASVEGWLEPHARHALLAVAGLQEEFGVAGGALEIGVHHGRLAIALSWLLRAGEPLVAIDVFGEQWMNIDGSGAGVRELFTRNWEAHANPATPLSVIAADSLALGLGERVRIAAEHGAFRWISVDGGHTTEHVVSDLLMVQDLLAQGGVVLLDDFMNYHWPGVCEGFAVYMRQYVPKLRPVALSANKLFLASVTVGERYVAVLREALAPHPLFKVVKMYGFDVVVG